MHVVPLKVYARKDCTRDGVPCATYCTGEYCQGLSGEERSGKNRSQTSVLHTDFD
jgi:hypothetical protein